MATVSHERSCGIDLHETVVQVCVLGADGEIEVERRFALRSESSRERDWTGQKRLRFHRPERAPGLDSNSNVVCSVCTNELSMSSVGQQTVSQGVRVLGHYGIVSTSE